MIDRILNKLIRLMIKDGVIESDDRELYEYAVKCIFITILPLLLAAIAGVVMGNIKGCLLVTLPFFFIRKFSGGFHFDNTLLCIISSVLLLIIAVTGSNRILNTDIISVIGVCSAISLILNSPVDSENRRLDEYERRLCRKIVVLICLVVIILYFLFLYHNMIIESNYIIFGIIIAAVLQMLAIFKNICSGMILDNEQ